MKRARRIHLPSPAPAVPTAETSLPTDTDPTAPTSVSYLRFRGRGSPGPYLGTEKAKEAGVLLRHGNDNHNDLLPRMHRPTGNREWVFVDFPRWMLDLLPSTNRNLIMMGAAIHAAKNFDPKVIKLGQTSIYGTHRTVVFTMLPEEAALIGKWGTAAKMTKITTIMRTLVMYGLGIPGVVNGVISPPDRIHRITHEKCSEMMIKGGTLTVPQLRAILLLAPPIIVHEFDLPPWQARIYVDPDDKVLAKHNLRFKFLSSSEPLASVTVRQSARVRNRQSSSSSSSKKEAA